jgi:LL-diaminopimelate aminotransferase
MIIPEAKRLENVKEYYFSTKLQQIADMQKAGAKVINLGIGSPDLMPSERTLAILNESARNPKHHGYQSYRGAIELRQAISDWYHAVYKANANPATEILPLIGSKEGIMHITMAFVNPGDKVLVPNPGYPTYTSVSTLAGAEIVYYDLDENKNWTVDLEKLKKIDFTGVKIMWINYPNMPTGASATPELFRELIALAREKKFLICNDNPYSLVLNDNPDSIMRYEHSKDVCIELNSLSKSHNMAGWRIGWAIAKQEYINAIIKYKSNMDSGMFLPMQHAAVEALKNDLHWHAERNAEYARRRSKVLEIMQVIGCKVNSDQVGLFVWGKAPETMDNVETYVEKVLLEAHVFLTPGFIFGSNGKRYIRISLCNTEKVLQEALDRIKNWQKTSN